MIYVTIVKYIEISIHAPARGATHDLIQIAKIINGISIHAPARGATQNAPGNVPGKVYFNPRSREGSD